MLFRKIVTADTLRQQAQTDDQVARALLTQAAGVNCRARDRRDEALALDQEEAKTRLLAEMYRAEQIWRKAGIDVAMASDDAAATLAVANKAQADFEAAVKYVTDARQHFEATKAACEAFTGETITDEQYNEDDEVS